MTLLLDTTCPTLFFLRGEHSHNLKLSKSYKKRGVFTFLFANPSCCVFLDFFLLHNVSKRNNT